MLEFVVIWRSMCINECHCLLLSLKQRYPALIVSTATPCPIALASSGARRRAGRAERLPSQSRLQNHRQQGQLRDFASRSPAATGPVGDGTLILIPRHIFYPSDDLTASLSLLPHLASQHRGVRLSTPQLTTASVTPDPTMASITSDPTPDTWSTAATEASSAPSEARPTGRTLLICPPALSAQPDTVEHALQIRGREHTDIAMLDRIGAGQADLRANNFAVAVIIVADLEDVAAVKALLLQEAVWAALYPALRPGAELRLEQPHTAIFGAVESDWMRQIIAGGADTQAILAGFTVEGGQVRKPMPDTFAAVPLLRANGAGAAIENGMHGSSGTTTAKVPNGSAPVGVGFVSGEDGAVTLDEDDDDDELIDEDTLLDEEDLAGTFSQRKLPSPLLSLHTPVIMNVPTDPVFQPSNASPSPASAAAPARTAPAASPKSSPTRTRRSARRATRPSPS